MSTISATLTISSVYHNLFGYILKASEDVLEFIEFFRGQSRDAEDMEEAFGARFAPETQREFVSILSALAVLVDSDEREENKILEMVPVPARWITVRSVAGKVTFYALDQSDREHVFVAQLDDWGTELWQKIDSEKRVAELIEEMKEVKGSPVMGLKDKVLSLLAQLTHHEMQVLKLSAEPPGQFKHRRHGMPPYLISTMPYEKVTAKIRDEADAPIVRLPGVKREAIAKELLVQDAVENRLADLFSQPHQVLNGLSYGGAMYDYVVEHRPLSTAPKIIEFGGGSGAFAEAFLGRLKEKDVARFGATHYLLVCQTEEEAKRLRERLKALPVEVMVAKDDAFASQIDDRYELAFCNEIAANLAAHAVRRFSALDEFEDEEEDEDSIETSAANDTFIGEGDAVQLIFKYNLKLDDSPEDFYLNTGAFSVLDELHQVLDEDGQIFLIEFGELYHYPVRTNDEDGQAYSLHFGHMIHVGKKLGYDHDFAYLMEQLPFDRDVSMFSTTRSQFKALRHALGDMGIRLERRAYTEDEFKQLLGARLAEVGELLYEPLEDRVMGHVLHSYKILRLFKATLEERVEL